MALPSTAREGRAFLFAGLVALVVAMLVHLLPRHGVVLPARAGDFATGLLYGLAFGLLLLGIRSLRHR